MKNIINLLNTYTDDETQSYEIHVNGEKVGFACILASGYNDDSAYCENIEIAEDYRNQGIGTAALYELSSLYNGIMIAADNEDANRLYERIGCESRYEDAWAIDQGYGVYEI